ncbi:pollen-specific leucine-rich repeat extensin-like protein 2 [Vicia villosa]|uniref:pollen-specific leucine-rich repeat extensin-like protein 2 n=1 Tax=Vicia villosa TaxID=3911 RepID=UPI00273B4288|nr:pollen-specific leucine-rich repeat extensin-like protein 2 [Vicia villosa]
MSPNSKEIANPSSETTQCIDLTSTSPIPVESSPQTVVISQAPVSLQTETISNVENLSTLETSDTDMINIFSLENFLSSPPADSAHQPPSPISPHTPASNPNPDAQLFSLISMLEAELLTPPASNQQTSIIPRVVTYTSLSMTIVPVSATSPLNSPKSYKEPSPPRIQLTSINHTDSDDLTAQIEAFFNNPIQLPEQTSLTETHAMPSVPQSDPYIFQTNSPIFSSPKEDDDNSFNVQTLLAPRYDSSPPRNTTNNSNTLPQHPIVSITSSFFNNFPSIGNRPPVYPRTTTSSDTVNPHQGISLRSLTALQKQGMAYQKLWVDYVTEKICPRFPGMLPPDPSQIQFPILPLSSEATSDDEPSVP